MPRNLSEILVKRDYSKKFPSTVFYKDSPTWNKILTTAYIFMIVFAGLGEGKALNNALGGLPKAVTIGILCMAVGYGIIYPDIKRIRTILFPTLVYMLLIFALMLWSMVIWILNFAATNSMIRACSKLAFQSISILAAVSCVYLFGAKAVDLFTIGVSLANAFIMLLEVPAYGIGPSIQSLITCLVTFGDAEGYARRLEIHDLTFVFGQLILYYTVFSPRSTASEKKRNYIFFFICLFFFLVGMKRIAIPAVVLFILFAFLFQKINLPKWFFPSFGLFWIIFFLFYIYGIKQGVVSQLLNSLGIDMMGREYMWYLASQRFEFSITYIGHGFEYVDSLAKEWYNAGILKAALAFHNDILKVFVELGFPGFLFWSGIQYIITPVFWAKYSDNMTALLYMCDLSYMTMTYLTDNTAFYFWSTMALRLLPLAYSVERKKPPKPEIWKPRDKKEMHEHIRIMMQESEE